MKQPGTRRLPHPLRLRRVWFALCGGSRGCPRKRFFISLLLALTLTSLLLRYGYFPCAMAHILHADASNIQLCLDMLLGLLQGVLGIMATVAAGSIDGALGYLLRWVLAWVPGIPCAEEAPAAYTWACSLVFYICFPLYIVLCSVIVTLCWRRLKDAGRSVWHLCAGLTCVAGGLMSFLMDSWGGLQWFLSNLGGFWLLYLYCQPTRTPSEETPDAMPPVPPPPCREEEEPND